MTEFKRGDRVSAWKMGNREGKERIVGTYEGTDKGGRGDFAIVKTDDDLRFRVRPGTLLLEASA